VPEVDLARALAHELEPSLIALDLRLRSLMEALPCREQAESCLAEVDALRSLLRDYLFLGRVELERRPFPLAPVLAMLARRFEPLAAARGIVLEVPPSTAEAEGDTGATERALSNLLDNALKFSFAGSRIEVAVHLVDGGVGISVKDQGIGIPLSDQAQIFEPFVRLDREKPGGGLGLSIARKVAEAQGGRLTVSSEPGKGATFVLLLRRP
jgi:signal transduction histidine kinase